MNIDVIVALLELLRELRLIGAGNAGPGVAHRYLEQAIVRLSLNGHFADIGGFDCVADEVDQDLRQAAPVIVARRQSRSHLDLERPTGLP
jgi:hypothetical protein